VKRKQKPQQRRRGQAEAGPKRVHLTVIRDPASGNARIELRRPIFQEDWQNEVAKGTANTAYALLADQPTHLAAVELAESAMAGTSRLAEGLLAQAPHGSVACRAGCDHCCYQVVGVTAPEALAISLFLKGGLSEAELGLVTSRLESLAERTQGLSAEARFAPDYACAFLEDGQCSIYEVRPLSCRGMNSLDAEACAKRLRDPEARAEFLRNGSGALTYMEPIRAFHAVSAGLQVALSELYGLDMRPLDLSRAVLHLLKSPDTTVDEWLAGGTSFESALGADTSGAVHAGQLSGTLARG
jgi:Fe-S-cluster containining protein